MKKVRALLCFQLIIFQEVSFDWVESDSFGDKKIKKSVDPINESLLLENAGNFLLHVNQKLFA